MSNDDNEYPEIPDHILALRPYISEQIKAAEERGFAAGVEQAASVCDERAKEHEEKSQDYTRLGDDVHAEECMTQDDEAVACARAIRALAAPTADGTGA